MFPLAPKQQHGGVLVVEYGMRVPMFGDSPFHVVTIYGLRRASEDQEDNDRRIRHFVEQHLYVVDCLILFSSIIITAQETLAGSNLSLLSWVQVEHRAEQEAPSAYMGVLQHSEMLTISFLDAARCL